MLKKLFFILATAVLCAAIFISCESTQFESAEPGEILELLEPEKFEQIASGQTKALFKTNVPKASLYANSNFLGLTPLEVSNLMPGDYLITIKKAGYKTVKVSIQVKDGISDFYYVELELEDSSSEQEVGVRS